MYNLDYVKHVFYGKVYTKEHVMLWQRRFLAVHCNTHTHTCVYMAELPHVFYIMSNFN